MLVLGIETSCDETAAAVVDEKKILSNVIASQVDLHALYGGVVPELACRSHIDILLPVIDRALNEAKKKLSAIELIAVTEGPGLIGALLIGVNCAKGLSLSQGIPFIGVNHIQAHLYAPLFHLDESTLFPCLGAVLSGGHTAFVILHSPTNYEMISQTVDDAIGEAFDKVAKMLGLPYPGGPEIESLAKRGDPYRFLFKAGQVKQQPLAFSFSGLKTAVLYTLQKIPHPTEQTLCDIAASFQQAAFADLVKKLSLVQEKFKLHQILFGGGVTNSQTLRAFLSSKLPNAICHFPPKDLSLDNAAMIAGLGLVSFKAGKLSSPFTLEARPNLALNQISSHLR
jgi:N6-L-threonylcarbamoyladenine synthase